MSLAEYPDPLAAQEKVETTAECSCGIAYKITTDESTTLGQIENYLCPECRKMEGLTNDFKIYKETFLDPSRSR
jgi:hypothetical protein